MAEAVKLCGGSIISKTMSRKTYFPCRRIGQNSR